MSTKKNEMVNKCAAVIIGLAILNTGFAQFELGKKLIGGGFSFQAANEELNSTPVNKGKSNIILFNASLSRFKTPSLVTGIGLVYGYNYVHYTTGDPANHQVSYAHLAGIFYNQTKLQPIGKNVLLALGGTATLTYGFGKANYSWPNYIKSNSYGAALGATIGIWYQLTPRFIITGDFNNLLNINYTHENRTIVNTISEHKRYNSFTISSGLSGVSLNSLAVGVRYVMK